MGLLHSLHFRTAAWQPRKYVYKFVLFLWLLSVKLHLSLWSMPCTTKILHSLVSVIIINVKLPTSTKFHSMERFCELYDGRLEGKQLMNDVRLCAGNESVWIGTGVNESLNISAEYVQLQLLWRFIWGMGDGVWKSFIIGLYESVIWYQVFMFVVNAMTF